MSFENHPEGTSERIAKLYDEIENNKLKKKRLIELLESQYRIVAKDEDGLSRFDPQAGYLVGQMVSLRYVLEKVKETL
jgi:hypothetical protein